MRNREMMGMCGLMVLGVLGWPPNVEARQVALDVSLAHPTLLAGDPQTTYLKVGLQGFEAQPTGQRPPVNVALVLDKSGSMSGEKLTRAKEAAIRALDRLAPTDIVAVIAYDSTVQVVVPATRVADRAEIRHAISTITAGGNTALFAGVSKGAAEVRKFFDRHHVNRIILLSDGLANVGPSSPHELGQLGAELMKENMAVSTFGLGLGYNEDLMVELARHSDGNHMFVEDATELTAVFDREFKDVLSVVAQEVAITIRCAPGIRPVRLLGVNGEINGQEVIVQLNQLYSQQEKYVLLEIAVPGSEPRQIRAVADVAVAYANLETRTVDRLTSAVSVHFDANPKVVEDRQNAAVLAECVLQIANLRNEEAVALRDRGETERARELLLSNQAYLGGNAEKLGSDKLRRRAKDNYEQSRQLDEKKWRGTRKGMREQQYDDAQQQRDEPDTP